MPIDYFIWAVSNGAQTFVVDTGFDAGEARARGRTLLRTAAQGLETIGIDASKVEDVIVTHLHYDHAGGHDQFPAARFHLQESEMHYATGRHMCSHVMAHPFTADLVADMVRRVFEGRVGFVDGERQLADGLSVHLVGGHSMGLQVVRVRTARGWVVLASDASHFYENMEAGAPFPIVFNVADMVRGWDKLKELASGPDHIVPGHDPLVLERYPAVSADLEGVAVRLDVT
jgi:glyoxylase-like metal-dependent hydrolase (beta-lactamase superfamily II)